MATFNKFNAFVLELAKGTHNLNTNTLKVLLTNVAPVATNATKVELTEIAAGNGYSAGGNTAAFSSGNQTSGVYKLILSDPATWTAAGGAIGPFRYAVLYNDTPAAKNLIGWWDYGSSITLADGEQFIVDMDQVNGVLSLT